MNFRTDINGLRTIALLGVVLFHFFGNALPGGFSGVDVFFVISGFLMTSIIFKGLEAGSFNLIGFYVARARRIIPALTGLCLALLILGWFYLYPADFSTLSKHVLGSLTFSSNVMYLKESGYFDEASKEKWLLHTWSLSVEWQFYIIYPIMLLALKKFMPLQSLRYAVILGAVGSFALCVYATDRWPSSAFYMLPTRAWEMLVGALAFLYPLKLSVTLKKCLEASGFALIFAAYAVLTEKMAWPGYAAAFPVAGALLVIMANHDRSWLTGNVPIQWLGTISYSVYLWHWPLVVWLNYSGNSTNLELAAASLLTSVGLGALSYYSIEKRRKRNQTTFGWTSWQRSHAVLLFALTSITSAIIAYQDGFNSRLSEEYRDLTEQQVMPRRENGYCFYDFNNDTSLTASNVAMDCILGASDKTPKVLLFGDSFAGHFEPFWDSLGKANGLAIRAVTTNWCLPILGKAFDGPSNHPAYQQCMINRQALAATMKEYDLIVFAGQWSNSLNAGYLKDISNTIRLTAETVPMVILMPPPTRYDTNVLKRFQRSFFYHMPFNLNQYTKELDLIEQSAYAQMRKHSEDLPNVLFIQREQLFSPSDTYIKSGQEIPYSLDGMHITLDASLLIYEDFQKSGFYQEEIKPRLNKVSRGS